MVLGIHGDAMPPLKQDCGVVGVRNLAAYENGRVTLHGLPIELGSTSISFQQRLPFLIGQSVGKLGTNVDGRPASSIQELADMRFSSAATKWFVFKHEFGFSGHAGCIDEKPFALPDEGVGLAAVTLVLLSLLAGLQMADDFRLQCFFRGDYAAYSGSFGNSRNKPMAFVMPAKKLVFCIGHTATLCGLSNHQQQMTISGSDVQDLHIGVVGCLDVKELAAPVGSNVDNDWHVDLSPLVSDQRANLDPGSEFLEFRLNEVGVHDDRDTEAGKGFASFRRDAFDPEPIGIGKLQNAEF